MLPSQLYQQHLARPGFRADALQAQAMQQLDALQQRLLNPPKWFARSSKIRGLYLWGSVGIGKSFLVDVFFASLANVAATRQHYQHFMAMVHKDMNAVTGHANPLRLVGKKLAAQYRVICLDELYITDMGDAMIVYHLFESLFDEGVTLLITSNFAPERLYRDDLQPAIFEPAIKLIRANTEELHLASSEDYRKLQVGEHQTWFVPGERDFALLFSELNQQLHQANEFSSEAFEVQQHRLQPQRYAQNIAWFSFAELCEKPRSARDYLQLAQRFKVFLLSDVPQFGNREVEEQLTQGVEEGSMGGQRYAYSNSENAQRRFMSLIDELYDQGIKLYVQGAVPLLDLYTGGRLAFEFQRTISRLTEMQSAAYRDRALRA